MIFGSLRGPLTMSEDIFYCHTGRKVLPASSESKPWMLIKHFTMPRADPTQQRNNQPTVSVELRLRNPG